MPDTRATYGGSGWVLRDSNLKDEIRAGDLWAPFACDSGSSRMTDVLLYRPGAKLAEIEDIDRALHLRAVDPGRLGRQVDALAATYELPMSIANSAGIMYWPESHAQWNRPGYMLYGNSPAGAFDGDETGLVPAMSMNSEIFAVRQLAAGEGVGYGQRWTAKTKSTIGTIPIGYGDGYPRHAPDGTPVLVKGTRVPLVGAVSMDTISVDLTGFEDIMAGDPVELWGPSLSVNEVASHAGTIGYQILAGLSGRVPLVYTP